MEQVQYNETLQKNSVVSNLLVPKSSVLRCHTIAGASSTAQLKY